MPRTRKRKKSKYKHLVINKKKFYFYKIKWLDITADQGMLRPMNLINLNVRKWCRTVTSTEKLKSFCGALRAMTKKMKSILTGMFFR